MKKLYVMLEKFRNVVQSFFGGLLGCVFNFITDNLNPQHVDEDIEYKTVKVSRIVKVPKKQKNMVLHKSIMDYGYDPHKFSYITLDSDNNIIDGHKRLTILKSIHGNYLKLDVKMITFNYKKEITLARKQLLFGLLTIILTITTIILIIR